MTGLHMNLATMVQRLEHEVQQGPTLDAYLLAAGISQITDDYLHAPAYPFDYAAEYLAKQSAPSARVAAAATSAVIGGLRMVTWRRATILRWRRELSALVSSLAQAQVGDLGRSSSHVGLARSAAALAAESEQLPLRLRQAVVRLPACFHHFDQRPADVMALAERFAAGGAARDRALLVVGVRTSGSYLAPLCAASLNALGYPRVRTLTVRPGHSLLRHERVLVGSVARERGLGLVLDDPPVTGSSVAAAAGQIERVGIPRRSIVLLLQTFGASEPPAALEDYEAVIVPSNEWSVASDLEPKTVRRVLSELLGREVPALTVDPVPLPLSQPERGHMRGRFRVRAGGGADDHADREVLVEGVGLGYLGAHRLATPELVERFSPTVLGLRDGLLYREWIPDEQRVGVVTPADEEAISAAVATYVSDRTQAMPLEQDLARQMAGQQPAWEIASGILSQAFGRGWPIARVLLTDRAAKRLLRARRPSVVDGNTDLTEWFRRNGSASSLIKPDIGEDRYSNLCPPCFDAGFDLAGVTARSDAPGFPRKLRRAFAELAGDVVDEERWLLYELIHLWGRERTQPREEARLRRARARALQRYFADVYLRDIARDPDGPLCAFDIDGVLESEQFGFSGVTPAAALGLRSLLLHGYRPVLASGRSLGEVSDRCRTYGLAGGVAEYGAVTFQTAGGRVDVLLPEAAASALDRLRAALGRIDGIHLDQDYRFSVRAFTLSGGSRRAVPERIAQEALTAAGDTRILAIAGDGQTDFVAHGVSKGPALRALAAALGVGGERPFALAVGDTAADLDFADVSPRPYAPRHADPVLRQAGFEVTSRPYQSGLAQAVSGLVGHPPGGCATCAMPAPPRERAIAASLLGVSERGRAGIVLRALQLGWRLR